MIAFRKSAAALAAAILCSFVLGGNGPAGAVPLAPKPVTLALNLTIKSSGGLSGTFPASLTYSKGVVTGSITINSKYNCVVNSGSTDVKKVLNLSCTVPWVDTATLKGTLSFVTGTGKGTVSDTLYHETGTYKFAKA